MKRNVNLYRGPAASASDRLSARNVAVAWGVVVATLLALQWSFERRADNLARANVALELEAAAAEEAITARAAARIAGPDPQLEARLAAVMHELDLRETILGLLSGAAAGDVGGFSAQLRSLARQSVDNVWLTRVAVSAPGARTTLEGAALAPEYVPVYLRGLSAEPALAGQRFDRFEIVRATEPRGHVHFALNRLHGAAEDGT